MGQGRVVSWAVQSGYAALMTDGPGAGLMPAPGLAGLGIVSFLVRDACALVRIS